MGKMIPWRVTIHCSASPNGEGYDVANIRRDHLARGWSDVGYHTIFQPDGEIQRGRSLNEKGAGVQGDNEGNLHFCLVGTDRFTREQFNRLREQLDAVMSLYPIKPWEIYTHREFKSAIAQGKTCPGFRTGLIVAWYVGYFEAAIKPLLCTPR